MVEIMTILLAGVLVISLIAAFVLLLIWVLGKDFPSVETPEKRAGRQGERLANMIILEILRDEDVLLTNVNIMADEKQTELDNVIINRNGVFIIEVKNYAGELFGGEDDFEWIKNKITPGGSCYQKTVKNPIKQVKRQIYILSRLLKYYNIDVWIEGYVFFVQLNSPVESSYVLKTQKDIDAVIHGKRKRALSEHTIDEIRYILS